MSGGQDVDLTHEEKNMPIKQDLTFAALRRANTLRLPLFKNGRGEPAHSRPDGSDWTLGEWMNAILGELGEAANMIKKIRRGDVSLETFVIRDNLAMELADIVTYGDITCFQMKMEFGFFNSFDELRKEAQRRIENSVVGTGGLSLGEWMNSAFGHFGRVAAMVDYRIGQPHFLYRSPTVSENMAHGLMAIACAAQSAGMDLGGATVGKFNTVSARVGADVFINVGNEVVNAAGERL